MRSRYSGVSDSWVFGGIGLLGEHGLGTVMDGDGGDDKAVIVRISHDHHGLGLRSNFSLKMLQREEGKGWAGRRLGLGLCGRGREGVRGSMGTTLGLVVNEGASKAVDAGVMRSEVRGA